MTQGKQVTVWIRRTEDQAEGVRELRFEPPDGFNQQELLEHGWAVDGRTAIKAVRPVPDENVSGMVPLAEVLRWEQEHTVKWLAEKGYSVQFS